MADKGELNAILTRSAQKAARAAAKTLDKVKRKVGFLPLER